jgi:ABC-type sulfate transport system substrate-binding protein
LARWGLFDAYGKAKSDKEHKIKFNDLYLPLLKKNPAIKGNFKTEDAFLNNYQIMRNIIHIDKDSYVIFIYPRENSVTEKEARYAKNTFIENRWRDNLILFTWEDLIEQLKINLNSQELINYYDDEFCYKYLKY